MANRRPICQKNRKGCYFQWLPSAILKYAVTQLTFRPDYYVRIEAFDNTDMRKRATVYTTRCAEVDWQAVSLRPPEALRTLVHSVWFANGQGRAIRALLPATGCVDVGFIFDAPLITRSAMSNAIEPLSNWWIEGLTQSFIESMTSGPTTIIGFRLYPMGAYNLFGKDVVSFSDQLVPGSLLNNENVERLYGNLLEASELQKRFQLLETFLMRYMGTGFRGDPQVAYTAMKLATPSGHLKISDFCRDEGIGYLRLVRIFREQLGVTPKRYMRIARFRRAFNAIASGALSTCADLASELGYYDQSHLIRDFRQMTGCAPREFLGRADSLSQSVAVLDAH